MADYYRGLNIGPVLVVSDGKRQGPFNRSAAYNRGRAQIEAQTYLWNEGDTLIPAKQIYTAVEMAHDGPGLVVPFTERHELDSKQTKTVLAGLDPFPLRGNENVFPFKSSIGQAGVTSRNTLDLIGRWDESFSGWGYDDNAMQYIFETLAGQTKWVDGKGIHLYHLPGYATPSPEQAEATERNAKRLEYLKSLAPHDLRQEVRGG